MELKRGNPKALEAIALNIEKLRGLEGRVGWLENVKYESGVTVAQAAMWNEFGNERIPMRPFFRPTIAAKKEEWKRTAALGGQAIINGTAQPDAVMYQLVDQARGDVEQTILELFDPALSPVTLELRAMKKKNPNLRITGKIVGEAARKVSMPGYKLADGVNSKPLVDSGKMIAELKGEVIKT